ncbi:hypothetical protein GCM10009696_03190 [Kocuria himachalensis]
MARPMASATADVPQKTRRATTDISAKPLRSCRSGAASGSLRATTRRRRPAAQAAPRTHSAMTKGTTQASCSGTAPPRIRAATASPTKNHVPRRAHRATGALPDRRTRASTRSRILRSSHTPPRTATAIQRSWTYREPMLSSR